MAEKHRVADILLEPYVVESIKHARRNKYYLLVLMGVMTVMLRRGDACGERLA
jgi:hypothetical protein